MGNSLVMTPESSKYSWVLYAIAIILLMSVSYFIYSQYQLGNLKASKQEETDFWFRSIGIGGLEGGVSKDECLNTCEKVCLGPRPDMNPLNLTLLLPLSRLRISCHDNCNKKGCNVMRPDDTICGHRANAWSILAPVGALTTCLFD